MTPNPLAGLYYYPHRPRHKFNWIWLLLALFLFLLLIGKSKAEGYFGLLPAKNINMKAICIIESSENPYAVNEKTHCYGAFQISYVLLTEWNKIKNQNLTILSLYYFDTNYAISKWYWDERLPELMFWFGIPLKTDYLIACYNWGVGNVFKWYKNGAKWNRLPKETQNYIKRYHQLADKKLIQNAESLSL